MAVIKPIDYDTEHRIILPGPGDLSQVRALLTPQSFSLRAPESSPTSQEGCLHLHRIIGRGDSARQARRDAEDQHEELLAEIDAALRWQHLDSAAEAVGSGRHWIDVVYAVETAAQQAGRRTAAHRADAGQTGVPYATVYLVSPEGRIEARRRPITPR